MDICLTLERQPFPALGPVALESFLGTDRSAALFTLVLKAVWKVDTLHMVSDIRFGCVDKFGTYRAMPGASSLVGGDVLVEIFRFCNVA
jgi:hypothetical protein